MARLVNRAGRVVTVTEDRVETLLGRGFKRAPAEPAAGGGDLDSLTVAELRDLASVRGVDLGDATRKADIIAVLKGE